MLNETLCLRLYKHCSNRMPRLPNASTERSRTERSRTERSRIDANSTTTEHRMPTIVNEKRVLSTDDFGERRLGSTWFLRTEDNWLFLLMRTFCLILIRNLQNSPIPKMEYEVSLLDDTGCTLWEYQWILTEVRSSQIFSDLSLDYAP